MVAGSYSKASVSRVPLGRLWKASSDGPKLVPKLMPDHISHVDVLQGDGGVGTVVQLNFGKAVKDLKYVKNRCEAVDEENHTVKFSVVEGGDIGTLLKSCVFEVKYEETSEGGTKTTVKMDYDTLGNSLLSQEQADRIVDGLLGQSKAVEAHLHANPTAYI